MSPARLTTEIFPWCECKTAKPKDIVIRRKKSSGLPAEIKNIVTDINQTAVVFSSFDSYQRNLKISGEVSIEKTIELRSKEPRHDQSNLYVVTVTLIGSGSSISYEVMGGDMYPRRPNRVVITHI